MLPNRCILCSFVSKEQETYWKLFPKEHKSNMFFKITGTWNPGWTHRHFCALELDRLQLFALQAHNRSLQLRASQTKILYQLFCMTKISTEKMERFSILNRRMYFTSCLYNRIEKIICVTYMPGDPLLLWHTFLETAPWTVNSFLSLACVC